MNTFQIVVVTIAIVFLILILTFFGVMLKNKANSDVAYPPQVNTCPDYWMVDGSQCIIPPTSNMLNTGNLYEPGTNTLTPKAISTTGFHQDVSNNTVTNSIDFGVAGWNGTCGKKSWSNQNNIVWDGVSNYNSC